VGVVVDGDVLDVGEVVEVHSEVLCAEGGEGGAEVFVGVVAEGFWVGQGVPSMSLFLWM
jgi:hypothetical protein